MPFSPEKSVFTYRRIKKKGGATVKRIISFTLCLVILCMLGAVTVSAADDGIMPRYNNLNYTQTSFNIDSNGTANIMAGYTGYSGITTGAKITILLEKKSFIFFWKDVEDWVITSNEYYGTFVKTYAVSEGDYRVTITFEISGSGGATDVKEVELEDSY